MKKIILMFAILSLMAIVLTGCLGAGTMYDEAANTAEETSGKVMDLAVEGFNAQFTSYVGEEIKGTIVLGLLDKVLANNLNNDYIKINLIYQSLNGEKITNFSDRTMINSKNRYTVVFSKYDKDGCVSEITIEELAE